MTVVALVSARSGAVTVSSLALALAAPKKSVLVELDPAGGSVRAGFLQGYVNASIGLHRLATAVRAGNLGSQFAEHLVSLDSGVGNRMLLPGLTDPAQASAMAGVWEHLVPAWPVLERNGFDVVVDAGRVAIESGELSSTRYPAAVLRRADVVLLAVRQSMVGAVAADPVIRALKRDLAERGTGLDALGLLLVQETKQPAANEIAHHLQVPVLAQFGWDPDTARALAHGPDRRGLTLKSLLLRQARSAWEPITALGARRRAQLHVGGYASVDLGGTGG
ncbi:hypothetical protein [Streptacidiphilus anmyonensis]|uniref:hypothetical protein n=1 Tax=Streptacidiphilus anmyonensis TaxID=405782 RepID=UPI0005A7A5D9|nr:hypothetical protein [Streptacidiphilus anmyonensis]